MTLEPPDSHYLSAAVGWLELGNPGEANAELDRIRTKHQKHPNVLEVRWTIHAAQEKWESCVEIATVLTRVARQDAFGWIHLSFALHELKRTRDAYDNLNAVLSMFPNDWLMRYNMACYACQLGSLAEAEQWLAEAKTKRGNAKEIDSMALKDPDLAPLFK